MQPQTLHTTVNRIIQDQPVTDLHTHCYAPAFGSSPDPSGLGLWGIDELVTYHYLVAEVFRIVPAAQLRYADFWKMTKKQQADHIWQHVFVNHTPISEACRGVLTTIAKLGLDPNEKSLANYRKWFEKQTPNQYIDKVMQIANVDCITMTNAIFDNLERSKWEADPNIANDSRFATALRIDPLLRDWPAAVKRLNDDGYDVQVDFSGNSVEQVKRFLCDWVQRMNPQYVAMSLPPTFRYPDPHNPIGNQFIQDCLMPVCQDKGLPWAMMIGANAQVNPALKDAGDMVGKSDVLCVVNLCHQFPNNKFMVTMLARENQHELCVAARKFGNMLVFGCWWFLNNPSIIEEMTRQRIELLGTSFCPQHSDARILDQLIYKWDHSRAIIASVLIDKYTDLQKTGYEVTEKHIQHDAALLLRDNFRAFVKR